MEKYGVDESRDITRKVGTAKPTTCPECGAQVTRHGSVVLCPTHGSKPFEQSNAE